PMHGPQGAAWIFAPQKGADPEGVEHLDAGLLVLDRRIQEDLGLQVASIPGAGAAGAMGAGAFAFFGASLEAGIEVVLDAVNFEDRARDADLILTGEGRLDSQSLGGKVVVGVARRAKPLGVPVLALVGDIGDQVEALYDQGLAGIFSINRLAIDFSKARERSQSDLVLTVDNLMRFIRRMEEGPGQML
ncbi:MAG: glycerate kinase, partial [Clostridiaceae bacterium]|nr:glycerate kinase [Clostridiaceae bacterium]